MRNNTEFGKAKNSTLTASAETATNNLNLNTLDAMDDIHIEWVHCIFTHIYAKTWAWCYKTRRDILRKIRRMFRNTNRAIPTI